MNVTVIATAALPEYPKQEMTDEQGDYKMEIYTETELTASKDGDDLNGVSTLDLVFIPVSYTHLDVYKRQAVEINQYTLLMLW